MKFLFFGFLFLAALGLVTAMLVGVAIKLVMFLAIAIGGLAIVGWVMRRISGKSEALKLHHHADPERLQR